MGRFRQADRRCDAGKRHTRLSGTGLLRGSWTRRVDWVRMNDPKRYQASSHDAETNRTQHARQIWLLLRRREEMILPRPMNRNSAPVAVHAIQVLLLTGWTIMTGTFSSVTYLARPLVLPLPFPLPRVLVLVGVGFTVGTPVGVAVGLVVGLALGEAVGTAVAVGVGDAVGTVVAVGVGDAVGAGLTVTVTESLTSLALSVSVYTIVPSATGVTVLDPVGVATLPIQSVCAGLADATNCVTPMPSQSRLTV